MLTLHQQALCVSSSATNDGFSQNLVRTLRKWR